MYHACTKIKNVTKQLLQYIVIALLLSGCQTTAEKKADNVAMTAQQIDYEFALGLLHDNKLSTAATKLSELIRNYPAMTGAYVNLALLNIRDNKLEDAESLLSKALSINPDYAAAHNYMGIIYRNKGLFGKAEASYKKSLELDPAYGIANLNLAILYDVYLDQGQLALGYYKRYQQLSMSKDDTVDKWVIELERRLQQQS